MTHFLSITLLSSIVLSLSLHANDFTSFGTEGEEPKKYQYTSSKNKTHTYTSDTIFARPNTSTKSQEPEPEYIPSGYTSNTYILGKEITRNTNGATVASFLQKGVTSEMIKDVRREKKKIEKAKHTPLQNVKLKKRTVYYNPYKSRPIEIFLKKGYNTEIEFIDSNRVPLVTEYQLVGNSFFSVSQPSKTSYSNIYSIQPLQEFQNTNVNIRFRGMTESVMIRMVEDNQNFVDSNLKVVIRKDMKLNEKDNVNYRRNLMKELMDLKTIMHSEKLNYRVVEKGSNKLTYFEDDHLKIFKIDKNNQENTIVMLDTRYKIIGMKNQFSNYSGNYSIYFLKNNRNSFSIISNKTSDDAQEFRGVADAGLLERYLIVLDQ
jgi:hypothetical protein